MKPLLRTVILCAGFVGVAKSATVTGNIHDVTDAVFNPPSLRFIPKSTPLANGSVTILDVPRSAPVTNGFFSIKLVGGIYDTDFGLVLADGRTPKLVRILVPPNDTNTYNFNYVAALATNVGAFIWTNPYPSISKMVMAGVGLTVITNNAGTSAESVTLSAIVSAADLQAATNLLVSWATNSFMTNGAPIPASRISGAGNLSGTTGITITGGIGATLGNVNLTITNLPIAAISNLLASLNVKLNATGGFSTNQNLQSATFYKTNYFSDLLNGNTSSGNFKVYQIGNGLYYVGPVGGTFSLEDDNGASRLSAGIFDFSYGVYYTGQLLLDSGQLWDLANGVPAIIFGDDHLLNDSGGNIALDFNARILMGGWTAFGDLSIAAGYNNKINFDRTDTTSFARFVFYTGGDEMWDFGMRGDAANPNDLSFTVFGDPRLTLTKTTARMGVNTSNPQFTLDVNGTFNSRGAASFGASLYASNGIVSLSSNKLAVTTVSVSGSPFHFTNTFSKNIVVLLSRGELQGVGVNNSLWSAALTNGVVPVPLEINEWVSITNTVAPTMKWKPN